MKNLLLLSFFTGFGAICGLFLLCFSIIHLFRWAIKYCLTKKTAIPAKTSQEKPQKSEKNREKAADKPPEKIYYIVERKKKRESSKFSEPKEFRFK